MAMYIEPGVVHDEKIKILHISSKDHILPTLTLETCDVILFSLKHFFAVRITGTSKRHFDCCSVILKFNVEGKNLTNLYRYIHIEGERVK